MYLVPQVSSMTPEVCALFCTAINFRSPTLESSKRIARSSKFGFSTIISSLSGSDNNILSSIVKKSAKASCLVRPGPHSASVRGSSCCGTSVLRGASPTARETFDNLIDSSLLPSPTAAGSRTLIRVSARGMTPGLSPLTTTATTPLRSVRFTSECSSTDAPFSHSCGAAAMIASTLDGCRWCRLCRIDMVKPGGSLTTSRLGR
mmetsp:Transcript_18528/g.54937  ORF Transcript_18528/g.54937 Transcript_18528/m.54937 type:complete len:204 (+) Transcript_18528:526-1137(+)